MICEALEVRRRREKKEREMEPREKINKRLNWKMRFNPLPWVGEGIYSYILNALLNGLWTGLTVGKDPTRLHKYYTILMITTSYTMLLQYSG